MWISPTVCIRSRANCLSRWDAKLYLCNLLYRTYEGRFYEKNKNILQVCSVRQRFWRCLWAVKKKQDSDDPAEPVKLTVWVYYNGDQLESFNQLVAEFNDTTGREKDIIVDSYSQGTVNDLETNVMASAQGKVGASPMPNIFSAYADTAYTLDQMGELVDLSSYFTNEERAAYVDSYLEEGDFSGNGSIKIFPVAKSTEGRLF